MKSEADKIKSRRKWFFVIGILLIISIGSIVVSADDNSILNPNKAIEVSCKNIQGTPAWIQNGVVIGYGYNFPEQNAGMCRYYFLQLQWI